jgi:hypothetical protein
MDDLAPGNLHTVSPGFLPRTYPVDPMTRVEFSISAELGRTGPYTFAQMNTQVLTHAHTVHPRRNGVTVHILSYSLCFPTYC